MRYIRYTWSFLLLVAAILSPNLPTTIILLVGGVLTVALAISREQRLQRLVSELSDILAIARSQPSVAIERSLTKLQLNMLALVLMSQLIIFLTLLAGQLDITVARNYALLVLIALAPLGLEIELQALLRSKHKRQSETVRTAIGYASEDARALLAVVGLSFIATLWLNIPPALSALQILFITCVARPLLSGRVLQALPYKSDQRWRVMVTALLTYGSFIFFFIRHYYEPRYVDSFNEITLQASVVAFGVFIACQLFLILFEARQLPKLRLLALIAVFAAVVYIPGLQTMFMTAAINTSDWLWIILAGCTYGALYLLRHRPQDT